MNDIGFYFTMGWQHIIGFDAFDHQLFVFALTVMFTFNEWKKVLILITAFTIGHSITLALSTLNIVTVPTNLVEFLIPCTIVITAAANIHKKSIVDKSVRMNYYLAVFFGLFHGLGFANVLKFMLAADQSLGWSLLAFNAGLEAGQILVVIILLLLAHFIIHQLKVNRRYWIISVSALVFIFSLIMAVERFPYK